MSEVRSALVSLGKFEIDDVIHDGYAAYNPSTQIISYRFIPDSGEPHHINVDVGDQFAMLVDSEFGGNIGAAMVGKLNQALDLEEEEPPDLGEEYSVITMYGGPSETLDETYSRMDDFFTPQHPTVSLDTPRISPELAETVRGSHPTNLHGEEIENLGAQTRDPYEGFEDPERTFYNPLYQEASMMDPLDVEEMEYDIGQPFEEEEDVPTSLEGLIQRSGAEQTYPLRGYSQVEEESISDYGDPLRSTIEEQTPIRKTVKETGKAINDYIKNDGTHKLVLEGDTFVPARDSTISNPSIGATLHVETNNSILNFKPDGSDSVVRLVGKVGQLNPLTGLMSPLQQYHFNINLKKLVDEGVDQKYINNVIGMMEDRYLSRPIKKPFVSGYWNELNRHYKTKRPQKQIFA